jgi:hypothetical protein
MTKSRSRTAVLAWVQQRQAGENDAGRGQRAGVVALCSRDVGRPVVQLGDDRHVPKFHVPGPLAAKCRAYLARFGLLFGAFDLGLTADGSLDFYECNSAEQWHWLEAETGLPMTAALADLLELT